jgi:hypothetical protein
LPVPQAVVERLLDAERRVELGSAGRATEAGHVEFRAPTVEQKDVGLERREAALAHVLAEHPLPRVEVGVEVVLGFIASAPAPARLHTWAAASLEHVVPPECRRTSSNGRAGARRGFVHHVRSSRV